MTDNSLKMKPIEAKTSGNYSLPNGFNQKQLKRGSIEFALEVLKLQFKASVGSVTPYNKVFDAQNYNNFNTYDVINTGGNQCQYVFYGDVVVNAFDYETATNTIELGAYVADNLISVLAGLRTVAYDIAAYGGATQLRSSAVNNAFVTGIAITNNTGAIDNNALRSVIKLEGHLIRIY